MTDNSTRSLLDLSAEQRELLKYLLEEEGPISAPTTIPPRDPQSDAPLSFAQQRLWFLDQLQPGNPAYNIATGVRLNGRLDIPALWRSLALVVARHEALRTTFALVDGQSVQHIAPPRALPLPLLDLTALAAADRPAVVERLTRAEARAPFDLAHGPLLRATLLRLRPDQHILLLTMHHIVADGWSMGVLVRELTSAYLAYSQGQPATLPPLPIQYADYAVWQRQWLHGEGDQAGAEGDHAGSALQTQGDQAGSPLQTHLAYWTTQLQGAPALLSLPTDFPHPARRSFRGARQAVTLAPELVAQLHALSQRTGTTLFMTLLAGFALLLMHYSAQDDIVIGTPIAGRTRAETERLIGFFVNTLALRIDLAGNPSFVELLARVRTVALDAYAHQELPFERLVEALQPTRSLSHTPLFQVMFALQQAQTAQLSAPGLVLESFEPEGGTAQFDLSLRGWESPDRLLLTLEYSTELFEDATITRMLAQLQTLLAGIANAPDQPLTALPLSSPAEQQALVALGAASASFPATVCLHQLVEQQAARAPDAIALVAPDGQLSYRALLSRARQLAHFLQTHGVGRETIVGVLLEPSLDLVVALLAILQAGGAYLPLDPAAPPARLAFLLEDAQVKVLLTTMDDGRWTMDDALQSHTDIVYRLSSIVYLDADWSSIAQAASTSLPAPADPNQLAYLIYTSGSTGVPKGTLIPHANVVRLLLAAQPDCAFGPSDSWTLGHALSFDFAVWELWGALVWGGRLVLLPALLRRSPAARWALLVRERTSVLNQTPAAFQLLIDAALAAPAGARSLRLVIFGGEALDAARLAPWLAQFGVQRPQLLNMYGITETTVHVTRRFLTAEDVALARGGSRIGTGLADLALYVRLAGGQPAPLGVPGELYVGGPGLARGYLNRPDLTAEKFIPNPFAGGDKQTSRQADKEAAQSAICNLQSAIGMRLYATGDRVRWLASGELEYLGRLDQQVKLRGYRIELGEVAAALRAHPRVRDAVAALARTASGDARLVAYVVQGSGVRDQGSGGPEHPSSIVHRPSSIVQELRNQLGQTLPDYMIPAAYVLLERLPLTAHGKLDRAALPPPPDERPDLAAAYAAPRTPLEVLLAEIWGAVLGVAQVGIHDNFFELGGDSILSVQVLARAQLRGVPFSLQQLFQHQTIASLAQDIAAGGERTTAPAPRIGPFELITAADRQRLDDDIEDAYPLTTMQLGMIFHSEYSPAATVYHDVFSFHMRSPLDATILRDAVADAMQRHAVLRTSFDLSGFSEPLQLIQRSALNPLTLVDISGLTPDEQERTITTWLDVERHTKFDWSAPPLFRLYIHRRSATTYQFTLSFHHAILDGWSVAVLLTELFQSYADRIGDTAHDQVAPATAFRDFVALEQQAIIAEECRRYWETALRSWSFTPLPRWDTPHQLDERAPIRVVTLPLAPHDLTALKSLAQAAEVPIKSVALAAHIRVLSLLHNRTDVLTGLVVSGRPETADGTDSLGLFLNTVPFRLNLSGGSWLDLIRATFAVERELLPYRRYPLAEIQRGLGQQTLFETTFNFTHFHIYQGLRSIPELNLLEQRAFEETNFTLAATFSLDPEGSSAQLILAYDPAALSEQQFATIQWYYERVLAAMIAAPLASWRYYSLHSASEQRTLTEWGRSPHVAAHAGVIHQLFAAQAARTPDAIALVYETKDEGRRTKEESAPFSLQPSAFSVFHLTYRELNERANQLAHYLRRRGVGLEMIVGMCFDAAPQMIVGLLGILKAGAAYLPLDPASPRERLAFILQDAQAHLLLTHQSIDDLRLTIDDLGESDAPIVNRKSKIVNLDDDWVDIARERATPPDDRVTPGNLAYVIYTSGSTGSPKGVLIEHGSAINFKNGMEAAIYRRHARRFRATFNAPLTFDASVQQIMLLLDGHTLYLLPDWVRQDTELLLRYIRSQQLDLLNCTPTQLQVLVAAGLLDEREHVPALGLIAGEAVTQSLWHEMARADRTAFYNNYGPTECTVNVTSCPVERDRTAPAIGRPLANYEVYILNADGQPVPIGAPGELYVGGPGVARGYLGRPDLVAERFVPNPWGSGIRGQGSGVTDQVPDQDKETRRQGDKEPPQSAICNLQSAIGSRLYRTGDLVRFLSDGTIAFIDRIDQQVKLRGYRIEPGEVEAALRAHPSVQDAVAAVWEEIPGDKRLVAYIVPAETLNAEGRTINGPEWSSSAFSVQRSALGAELRAFLQTRLPDYMIPAAYVLLEALPLTPSGKLDRRALPPPTDERPDLATSYAAPRTPVEEVLVGIWAEVLGVAQVGIHDNFFELGGHSLRATQLVSRVRAAFGIELPVQELFEAPTISNLSTVVEVARRSQQGGLLPPITPVPRDGPLPLSFAQQRLWFLDQLQPNTPAYNVPAAVQLNGRLDIAALRRGLAAVVDRHEALRTTFATLAGQPVQQIAPALALALPLLDLAALPTPTQSSAFSRLMVAETKRPFDLRHGPLLRATLLRLHADAHILLLTMHHIVSDGWSLGVLVRELTSAYAAYARGHAPTLPPLPIQYADYAIWQRTWLHGAVLDAQLAYWTRQLQRAPLLELPTDRPRPPLPERWSIRQAIFLSPELLAGLKALSQHEGATLFMTLLAAFAVLLQRHSGQSDLVIGTPIANRTRAETEDLIGFFVNTLALRADLSGNPRFHVLLARVRAAALDAYAHQDVPFEQLVEALQPERSQSHTPIFQVMFILQNAPLNAAQLQLLPDLAVRPIDINSRAGKFDLIMETGEVPEGMIVSLEYDSYLFEAATIRRMLEQFRTLLEDVIAHPHKELASLSLSSAEEQQQLRAAFLDDLEAE